MNCSCFEAFVNRILLPWWRKQHIIQRHFPSEERVGEERSLFHRCIPRHIIFNRAVDVFVLDYNQTGRKAATIFISIPSILWLVVFLIDRASIVKQIE